MVLVVGQFLGQLAGVVGRVLQIDRQAQLDGARVDGHQRAHIAVGVIVGAFFDLARRVGGKYVVSLAVALRQQGGQVNRPVQPLAGKLAEAIGGFFGMAQKHQGLHTVHRSGKDVIRVYRQCHSAGNQEQRDRRQGIGLESRFNPNRLVHGDLLHTAVKADRPGTAGMAAPVLILVIAANLSFSSLAEAFIRCLFRNWFDFTCARTRIVLQDECYGGFFI